MSANPRPDWPSISDAELAILKHLWDRGAMTVRALHGELSAAGFTWAYTTVQTMLVRLEEKGYVAADRSGLAHVFSAAVSRDSLVDLRIDELVDKLCDGTATPLVLRLVEGRRFSSAEIDRFRSLLDAAERDVDDDEGSRT